MNNPKIRKDSQKKKSADFLLLIAVFLLALIGVIMVYSASMPQSIVSYGTDSYFIKQHLRSLLLGFVAMFITSKIPYHKWGKISIFLFIASVAMNLLIFTFLADESGGAKRWIKFGTFSFMPSDALKMSSIILTAYYVSKNKLRMNTFRYGMLPLIMFFALIAGLMYKQNDFGTTAIILASIGALAFVSGLNIPLTLLIIPTMGFVSYELLKRSGFRMGRIEAYLDPYKFSGDQGMQIIQSLYALGRGGLLGVGIGKSTQKYFYLSECFKDYIFSIIGEELGLIGSLIVLLLYGVVIYRGIDIAMRIKDDFGKYLMTGFTAIIAIQALVHISVAIKLIPTTGVTLPFVSLGGTSLLAFMGAVGIMLNISKHCEDREGIL